MEWRCFGSFDVKLSHDGMIDKVYSVVRSGFPYKSAKELGATNDGMAFYATKHAIYSVIYNRDASAYIPLNTKEGKKTHEVYKKILENSKKHPVRYNGDMQGLGYSIDWIFNNDSDCLEKSLYLSLIHISEPTRPLF